MMADTTCKKKQTKKFFILTGVFCTVGGTLVVQIRCRCPVLSNAYLVYTMCIHNTIFIADSSGKKILAIFFLKQYIGYT
jgi:hypothetical protein